MWNCILGHMQNVGQISQKGLCTEPLRDARATPQQVGVVPVSMSAPFYPPFLSKMPQFIFLIATHKSNVHKNAGQMGKFLLIKICVAYFVARFKFDRKII